MVIFFSTQVVNVVNKLHYPRPCIIVFVLGMLMQVNLFVSVLLRARICFWNVDQEVTDQVLSFLNSSISRLFDASILFGHFFYKLK